jgi:hypothetical protein
MLAVYCAPPFFVLLARVIPTQLFLALSKLRYMIPSKKAVFHKQFFPVFSPNSFMHIHSFSIHYLSMVHSLTSPLARGKRKTQKFISVVSGVKINRQVGFGVANFFPGIFLATKDKKVCCFL